MSRKRCEAKTGEGKRCKRDATHGRACSIPAHQEQLGVAMAGPEDPGGHDKYCGGKTRRGTSCERPAGWGTDHVGRGRCKFHGGCTPTHRRKAQREAAEEAVVTYGLPREIPPQDALLEEIARTAGAIDWIERQLRDLEADEVTWGLTRETEGGQFGGSTEWRSGVNAWVQLYQKERQHYVIVCRTAIACGIAEREIQLAEGQAKIIGDILEAVLKDLGLQNDRDAREAVRKALTVIPGGKVA